MACQSCVVCKIVGILLIVGALNYGTVALLNFNIIDLAGGGVGKVVSILIGLAGVAKLVTCFTACPACKK